MNFKTKNIKETSSLSKFKHR